MEVGIVKIDGESAKASTCTNDSKHKESQNWNHSEKKVLVHNVMKFSRNKKEVDKMVQQWIEDHAHIRIEKTKKPHNCNWILITLEDENMVDPFIELMNDGRHVNKRGGILRASRASEDTSYHSSDRKKRQLHEEEDQEQKKAKKIQEDCVKSDDEVRDVITPLWRKPYEEQLKIKARTMAIKCLGRIVKEIDSKFR